MRAGGIVVLIGMVLIATSFTPTGGRGMTVNARYGEYEGMIFKSYGDVMVTAEDYHNRSFSMYILTWSNFQYILENASLEELDILVTFEKIDGFFETVVELPGTGFYAVLCTPYFNESIGVDLLVTHPSPKTGILIPGIGVVIVGVIVILLSVLSKRTYRRE